MNLDNHYIKSGALCAALWLGAAIASPAAWALDWKVGKADITIDTTITVGTQLRTSKQDCARIAVGNGGCLTGNGGAGVGANINFDDGNINFGQWDATSLLAKAIVEIDVTYENLGAFARVSSFYDYIGSNQAGRTTTPFGRRQLDGAFRGDDGLNAASDDIRLLDAFVYGNFTIADRYPASVRLGKQVVNWGESLAIQGGINQFNALNLRALRTPGAEIRDALVPNEMVHLSLGLPANFSVEAWYAFNWRETELDPVGTFFSGTDIFGPGGTFFNIQSTVPENVLLAGTAPHLLLRSPDDEPKDTGQYGVRLGYYADWLNDGTVLGLHFVNQHSKLPYLEISNGLPLLFGGAGGQAYRAVYPEDIELFGASFSTTIDALLGGTAFAGEILYQPNMPFALSGGETLLGRWVTAAAFIPFDGNTIAYDQTPGAFGTGFTRTDVFSGQFSTISVLPPSEPIVDALGADSLTFVTNWGFQSLPNVSSTQLRAMAVPRSEIQSPNPAVAAFTPFADAANPLLHPDSFSQGYRLVARLRYNSVFNTSWTLVPSIQFAHDLGTAAGPTGPGFLDNRKTVTLGLNGSYQNEWEAEIQWTASRGNSFQNLRDDKDFLSISISRAF